MRDRLFLVIKDTVFRYKFI